MSDESGWQPRSRPSTQQPTIDGSGKGWWQLATRAKDNIRQLVMKEDGCRPVTMCNMLHSWVILFCSADYATITLQLCKKKCFMFHYHSIIYMGIVQLEVYPTNSPSKKQHHHGVLFAATAAWHKRIGSPHPRGPLQKRWSKLAVKRF
jgi:hypothetical protein